MFYQHYLQCTKGLAADCMTNYYVYLHLSVMGFMTVGRQMDCMAELSRLTGTKVLHNQQSSKSQ
jgi:hypothetical protein